MNTDYTVSEYFTLPSKGRVYKELIDPQIKIRSMNCLDEMKRLSPSENQYQNLCSVLDGCLVEKPNLSTYDMCIGDYQFILYKLREVTYGSEYTGEALCPYCQSQTSGKFNMDDLPIKEWSEDVVNLQEFELPITKKKIRIKMTTPRMLDQRAQKLKSNRSKKTGLNLTLMFSIEQIVEEIDGQAPNPVTMEEWIKSLPMQDINTIIKHSEALDNSISVETGLTYTCEVCGLPFKSSLRTDNEFFRPSLEIGSQWE